ncbi:helix-turn-helix domain-containing protein [Bizionia sp.]|uniref:helix-turn-helix domain-containing protein n=1 Tax=Bizionia sp. TaxID=1954480 RepID=UPI003A906CDA
MSKNLNTVVSKTATRWKERAKKDRTNRRNITRSQIFALELMDYMDTHKLKQIDLAKKMDVTPQQVNKILRAKANLTFETLDKIADALGVTITPPSIKVKTRAHTSIVLNTMQVVHKRKQKATEANLTTKNIIKKNPVLETTMESVNPYQYTAKQI